MSNKIIVAKDGFNAITDPDPRHHKFNSDYNTLKYFDKITKSFTINGASGDFAGRVTHDHNLGYYPFVEVFVEVYIGSPTGDKEYVPFAGSGASVAYSAGYKITSTQIVLYGEFNGVSSSTWSFDFLIFLFKNKVNL